MAEVGEKPRFANRNKEGVSNEPGPLRPHSVVQLGATGLDPLPMHFFRCETTDVAAFAALMYALRDLVGDLRLVVSKRGIKIGEMIARENILISMMMEADVFESYECEADEMVVCFEPRRMYDCLSRHQSKSRMEWIVDPSVYYPGKQKKKLKPGDPPPEADFLMVKIHSCDYEGGEDSREFIYGVPLMRSYAVTFEAERVALDHFIAMDTTELNNILGTFSNLEKELASRSVLVDCNSRRIVFEMQGDSKSTVIHARFQILLRKDKDDIIDTGPVTKRSRRTRADDNNLNVVESDDVQKENKGRKNIKSYFFLVYLLRLQKCFSINRGFVYLKMREDYPLCFEVHVGTLGSLYISLMDHDPDNIEYN